MYIKDQMTRNPYCISPKTTISKALEIMSVNSFHRLPVVDSDYNLLGLITAGMISDKTPSKATSLSIYELNYLLSRTSVEEIMEKDVKTINPDALLEEAANKMRLYDISCLPVVENDKVVGIITHNDIFKAFIDLLGYNLVGTRYVINVLEDRPGILKDIAACFEDLKININNLAVYNTIRGIEVVVIATGPNNNMAKGYLEEKGYNVTDIHER